MDIFYQALATTDAKKQAEFFNGFYRCLRLACRDENRTEMQICYLSDHLDEHGRAFAAQLAAFAKLSLETRTKTEEEISELWRQRSDLERELAELRERREQEVAS